MDKALAGYLWGLSSAWLLASFGQFTLFNYLGALLGTLVGARLWPRLSASPKIQKIWTWIKAQLREAYEAQFIKKRS